MVESTAEKQTLETTQATITPEDIHLPPNSFWPIILAFGFSMIAFGLATNLALVIIGAVVTLVSTIGWVIEPVHLEGEEEGH
jgi:hypothetical protein